MASSIVSDGATAVQFRGVTINNDGRGVAVGTIGDGVNPSDFFVYRFDPQTLAGDEVYAITDFGGTADGAYAAVVQPDGKVVVAGLGGDDAALARYTLERPLAEFLLTAEEEQAWQFTYDENGQILTLPVYLIDRLRSPLSPDGVLTINGSDDDDVVAVSQSGGLITLDKNGESVSYDESLVTRIVFNGYDGDDLFAADPGISIPLSLNGGAGDDTLLAGAADDEIFGGDGHDILVGGDGADLLDGGAGYDILIGGNGADSLFGNEGDDILIGGYTTHDRDLVALTAIQDEWTSPRSYTNRVANLGGAGTGTGLNGTYHLRPGSPAVKTIFDDGAVDQLSGGGGLDWFIARTKSPADLLLDRTKGESLTQV
jgi:Ca2+-binding RTX toxin-like protein